MSLFPQNRLEECEVADSETKLVAMGNEQRTGDIQEKWVEGNALQELLQTRFGVMRRGLPDAYSLNGVHFRLTAQKTSQTFRTDDCTEILAMKIMVSLNPSIRYIGRFGNDIYEKQDTIDM